MSGAGQRKDVQERIDKNTALLHRRSEHDFSGYKTTTLIRRIQRRMQVLHISDAFAEARFGQGSSTVR